ncbi:MAG: leucine--tRNA ligase [Firmicutes bacterium]|nr:leucine--tRNA ligase [Bacillota bacterium]
MDYLKNEEKWRKEWEKQHLGHFDRSKADSKYYVLEMFSYPSGFNLHMGHWYNYAPSDTFARFKKMQGYNVFQPMGFDSFGLPAENHAIKTGIHPKVNTNKNIAFMEKQLKTLGAMYDWEAEVITSDPSYYRWTQWLFCELYKKGLAYQKQAPVNWCTSCNTVIANEQVVDGRCERCKSEVVRKNLVQWFFKITDYAEELLWCLDVLDWPEKTKTMQRNWIGRSEGSEIVFEITGETRLKNKKPLENEKITVFTTRADTLFGTSYVVLAPEHPLVDKITSPVQKTVVEEYKYAASKLSDIERTGDKGDKTGVFTGAYCTHPLTKEKLPVWIADYCLALYGTGAVMGVPAHDTRDFDFAKKYGLPIVRVIKTDKNDVDDSLPFIGRGVLTNSGIYDGIDNETAKKQITAGFEKKGAGRLKTTYKLRDWSVSRQRYWGCPIPIVYCGHCGAVPVPYEQLPVLLPDGVNFTPDGKSPLSKCEEYINTTCPVCGKAAKRDADTLDTFVCSSWYFLRYPDAQNTSKAFNSEIINKMLPVDKYVGGPEHACMHLLYARFMTKALRDMGYLSFDEPFKSLIHQGMILGEGGEKMSKSNNNVVNPDAFTKEYGSDVLRLFLMFGFSYIEGGPWSDTGIKASAKFLERVERILDTALAGRNVKSGSAQENGRGPTDGKKTENDDNELNYALHYAIKNVTKDLEDFSFNTAIARIMELVGAMYKHSQPDNRLYRCGMTLIKLIAPFVPHFAEEMNVIYGGKSSIFNEKYPVFDPAALIKQKIEIAVQVNSKIRCRIDVEPGLTDDAVTSAALTDENVKKVLAGLTVNKVIVVRDKLVNFIV